MGDLCTACLCGGRNLFFIGETGYYHLYSQILNEIPVYDVSELCIRVCWECRALLRRLDAFKQQVKTSYTQLLHYVHQSDLTNTLMSNKPNLQIKHVNNISIPEHYIKTEVIEDIVKSEIEIETHCEPETFVNDLDVEPPKRKKDIKKEKLTKHKSKKKLKKQKSTNKNKVKVKKKPAVPTEPLPIEDNDYRSDVDADTGDYEMNGASKTESENLGVEINVDVDVIPEAAPEMTNQLNGVVKAARAPPSREVLPEKPQCAECGKKFSSRKTYRYHLNVLHKGQNRYPCPRCGKVYQWKSNLGRHIRSHKARDSGELYCAVCDKRFASVATFRQHLRVSRRHVSETEFTFMCNECGKKFVNKTRLRDHIDWEHLNKIKFKCQLCNKPFKCHTSLYVHMQNVHRNKEKKDNLCHVCGKSYQNAAKLKYHIVAMHTSETPYQCEQCSAAFGWYSSLYRHVREVHYKMKVQPKKSKKAKKNDPLPSLLPPQIILPAIHHPGPGDQTQ